MNRPAQPPLAIALPRWQRRAIYVSIALLLISGVAWLLVTGSNPADLSPAARSAATWLLRLHGASAYAVLIVAGSVLPLHLRLGWSRDRNRRSGSLLVALLLLLALSGLWLYYGPESGRDAASLSHWIAGLVLPVWLLLHRVWGLRSRQRAPAASADVEPPNPP